MQPLKNLKVLFKSFHNEGIRYCQWKSNDHLMEGLYGITDLDILVDSSQSLVVQKTLAENNFKRGRSGFHLRYPSVEGYIGLDRDTGRMAYVHLHYRLILGKFRIKEYSFNWEELALRTRKYDSETDIYIIEPDLEMLLLLTRAALKIRYRDFIFEKLGRKCFSGNWISQYDWLRKRINLAESINLSKRLLGTNASMIYEDMLKNPVTFKRLLKFRSHIKQRIVLYREYTTFMSNAIMWIRELTGVVALINRKFLGRTLPIIRKIPSKGGAIIVFIGPDGSGKTTITKKIVSFFSWKLDILHVYLGAGQGSISLIRRFLLMLRKKAEANNLIKFKSVTDSPEKSVSTNNEKRTGLLYSFAKMCWALLISLEKQNKLKKAWMTRNQGIVVICDRYPQAQIMGFNDGPLLSEWLNHKSKLLRSISRWEMRPYKWANRTPPDLVIRLNVNPETSLARDPELSPEFVKRRIKAVNSFKFHQTPVIEIDANKPFDEVFHEVKNCIWDYI